MALANGAPAVCPGPRQRRSVLFAALAATVASGGSAMAAGEKKAGRKKAAAGRMVVYYQTQYAGGSYLSPLPLTEHGTGVTDVLVAAVHLNDVNGPYAPVHLNDDTPGAARCVRSTRASAASPAGSTSTPSRAAARSPGGGRRRCRPR
ncbi:hypothetical protein AB0O76_37365 [Streptomyces sp. NPDC086554]|uniref:hypothetical protein n=1 Tax=Streptomyces sp. NPDC086554 TaxID=3154864 RepID=UPI00343911D8